ncbi:MAG: hypothetical protein E6I28_11975 [Chloroflexi bacterium]|nr:MAG: hypothetical protein E6I28_11975 [Chloroflexota bacterium]
MSYMRYHIHERVVVLTVVLVVVSGVLVWSRPANAIGNYNRSAAVAYADQWALSRNSNYPQFGNDCTNFASQVLQAGGYPQTNPGSYFTCDPSLWYQPFFVNMWWYTYSWINADCMRQFFSNRPQDFELYGGSPEYLQGGGDILQIADGGGLTPMHARILTGPGYGSDGYYYNNREDQHTNDEYELTWNYALDPSWALYPWLVNW